MSDTMNGMVDDIVDDYFPGEGCECDARCACECGCDVDWTDPTVYELLDTVQELSTVIKDLMDSLDDALPWLISEYGYSDVYVRTAEERMRKADEALNRPRSSS